MAILIVIVDGCSPLPFELTPEAVIDICERHPHQLLLQRDSKCGYASGALKWSFELASARVVQFPLSVEFSSNCILNIVVEERISDLESSNTDEIDLGLVSSSPGTESNDIDECVEHEKGSSEANQSQTKLVRVFQGRAADYFLDCSLVATCEILLLRIKYYIQKFGEFHDEATRIPHVLGLFDQLLTRMKIEDVKHGPCNVKAVMVGKIEFEKFASETTACSLEPKQKRALENSRLKLLGKVSEWLRQFLEVDLALLLEHLHRSVESSESLAFKDAVFIIGATGVGKSTLVHFLTGSEFETKQSNDKLEVSIKRVSETCNVEGVKTSASYSSTTRYVNPIFVNCSALEQLGVAEATLPIILVDSPGFEDTNGPEIDISNSFGIVQAASLCSRVKLVFVCDNQVGSKGQIIKESLKMLIRMLGDDVESYAKAITWVFTKFSLHESVLDEINKLLDLCLQDNSNSQAFQDLIAEMKESAFEPMLVRPGTDQPADIYQLLATAKAIENPGERFRMFLSSPSEAKLRKQLHIHENSIKTSLRLNEMSVIVSKLSELRAVNKILGNIDGISAENSAVGYLSTHILRLIKVFDDILNRIVKSNESIFDADRIEFLSVCDGLVHASSLGEVMEMGNFVNSSFLKIELKSCQLFSDFSAFFRELNDSTLYTLAQSTKPLEVRIPSISRMCQRLTDLSNISSSAASIVSYKEGRIVRSLQKNVVRAGTLIKKFLDRIQVVLYNCEEPHRIENFTLIVEVLGFVKRFVGGFDVGEHGKKCVDTLTSNFLNFAPRIHEIKEAVRVSNFTPAELGDIVSSYNQLVGLSNLQNIGFVLDLSELQSSIQGLSGDFKALAEELHRRLFDLIPVELSIVSVDYNAIAQTALLLDKLSFFFQTRNRWEDRLRAHLDHCREAIRTGLDAVMSGVRAGIHHSRIAVAVGSVLKSGKSLAVLSSVGFFHGTDALSDDICNFRIKLNDELAPLLMIEVGLTPLSVSDMERYSKLVVICYQCNLLASCFQNHDMLQNNSVLKEFHAELLETIDSFNFKLSSSFVTRFRLTPIESSAQFYSEEVFQMCHLLDTMIELSQLPNICEALEANLTQKAKMFRIGIEERIHTAHTGLLDLCTIQESPDTAKYLASVRSICDEVHCLQEMLQSYNRLLPENTQLTTTMSVFIELFRTLPDMLLDHFLSDNGILLNIFCDVTRACDDAFHAKSYPSMKCLSASVKSLVHLDPLIQASERNSCNPFSGFQSLARSILDNMNQVVSHANSMITDCILQYRFEMAAERLNHHKNSMSAHMIDILLGTIGNCGREVARKLEALVRQVSCERFSCTNYFRLQEEVVTLQDFRDACHTLNYDQDESNDVLNSATHGVQLYFINGVNSRIKIYCDARDILELELFVLELTNMLPSIVDMINTVTLEEANIQRNHQKFTEVLVDLLQKWRSQADSLQNELVESLLVLPVNMYPTEHPKNLLETFLRCSTLLAGDRGVVYKDLHEALSKDIVQKLLALLSPSSGNVNFSYFQFHERVKTVDRAKPFLTVEIGSEVQSELSEAFITAEQMKVEMEARRTQFLDWNNITMNTALLENVIMQRDFTSAGYYKTTILETLHEGYQQYKVLIEQGRVLEGLEMAGRILVPTNVVKDTLRKCREALIKPKVVHFPLIKALMRGRGKYYYIDNGIKVYLPRHAVTEQMKRTMSHQVQRPSDVASNKELFSDDELTRAVGDIQLLLTQKLDDSVRFLESITVNHLDNSPSHVSVLLKLLQVAAISPGVDALVLASWSRIQLALTNFHCRLKEAGELCTAAFKDGQTESIRLLMDTAKVIEPSVLSWQRFLTANAGNGKFTFDADEIVRYSQLQNQLDAAIGEWINLLKAERFLFSAETTTRINTDRDAFYSKVNLNLQCISRLNVIVHHSNLNHGDLSELTKECVEHLGEQIVVISAEMARLLAQIPSEGDDVYIGCCNTYDNLRSIAENIERGTIRQQAQNARKEVNEAFNKKFREIFNQINGITLIPKEALAKEHIDICIEHLVQFKRMSNRLVIFSAEIDSLIDELTSISLQQGEYGAERFGLVALNLQARLKQDSGEHIRSLLQHKAFDEITNILRMERTKKFTIYHVLGFRNPNSNESMHTLIDDPSAERVTIEGEDIGPRTRVHLFHHFRHFDDMYWDVVLPGLEEATPFGQMEYIVNAVKTSILNAPYVTDQLKYRCVLAHIFAYWTLSRYSGNRSVSNNIAAACDSNNNTSSAASTSVDTYANTSQASLDHLVQPHPAQVVALFRLLGIEGEEYDANAPVSEPPPEPNESFASSIVSRSANLINSLLFPSRHETSKFPRHLVEIPTGEGKSVVLAVLATLMALLGYTVHCACYSAYLSKRDQDQFQQVFQGFGVAEYIQYGTFGSLCEKILDADGNIRTMVQTLLGCEVCRQPLDRSNIKSRPRLLLIDEVDVFFNRDYYGRLYEPFASINKPSLANMAKWLWNNRRTRNSSGNASWRNIIASNEFKSCMAEFREHKDIAEEMIKGMLMDLKTVTSSTYVKDYCLTEVNGIKRIAYKEQDGLNHNIIKGYQTMFHYLKEFEAKEISEEVLNQALVGRIYCGGYSYAEIPLLYDELMGVTGTLRQVMKGPQRNLLEKYDIRKYTYMPSVYGKSLRIFEENNAADVKIVEDASYYLSIVSEIEHRIGREPNYRRAVLVFFENAEKLDAFKNSPIFQNYRQQALVINETLTASDKDGKIRAAATTGQIVLLTKAMGRGTDFICYDKKLLDSGGVHVLQTFLSEQNTEETQIRGRTGRQGNRGSFSMVLRIDDLLKFGLSVAAIRENNKNGLYYGPLASARDTYFRKQIYPQLELGIKNIRALFEESKEFTRNLRAAEMGLVVKPNEMSFAQRAKLYLMKYNKVEMPKSSGSKVRVIVLMDATGSMESFLLLAQNTIKDMFQRLNFFIPSQGYDIDLEVQYVAYRNYNAPPEFVLEVSPWEPLSDNPARLFEFMDGVEPGFGLGNEAIEVAFKHVLDENKSEPVNAVILVGDKPPNTRVEVKLKRAERPQGWRFTRFSSEVYYEDVMKQFPPSLAVHCFYLDTEAADVFNTIALKTKGSSQPLDVKAEDAPAKLSACVSMHINRAVGGQTLVDLFRRTYNVPQGYIG